MALNIKNAETERLARELARRRGQGITEVVTDALRHEVERERRRLRPNAIEASMQRIDAVVREVQQLPVLDPRAPDDIIGYDDKGLFGA